MAPYVRPAIPAQEFRDGAGVVIPYGERWGMDGPPNDTYSVQAHPERFQPLHDIARALIEYLEKTYDVTASEEPSHLEAFPDGYLIANTAVRLTPDNAAAAPLTIAFTADPRVVIQSGALVVEPFPVCGCDACDDTWESAADRLEETVFAVIGGGLTESVSGLRRRTFSFVLTREHGASSGLIGPGGFTPERLNSARAALRALGGSWAPWSPRAPSLEQ